MFPSLQRRAFSLACCCILFIPGAAAAQRVTSATQASILLPWLELLEPAPVLSFKNELAYNPAGPSMQVRRSQWRVERLAAALFGGKAWMIGSGEIAGGKPSDVSTSVTLETVDVQRLLRFAGVPRAHEVEGRISGFVYVRVVAGEWADLHIRITTLPGTVRISRNLIYQVLGARLRPELIEQVRPTLDHYFGAGAEMIPIDTFTIDGTLGRTQLLMKIPIRNQALNIDFEPRVDRALLWEVWNYLKDAGLKDVQQADWKVTRPR